jgi:cytochrome c5
VAEQTFSRRSGAGSSNHGRKNAGCGARFLQVPKGEIRMKTLQMMAGSLTCLCLCTGLTLLSAHPQTSASTVLRATVPFAFEVAGKSLPAGTYQLEVRQGEGYVQVSTGKGVVGMARILTQIGGGRLIGDASLVFDEFEGRDVLSEVWVPGQEGVLVYSTPKQHKHERVIAVFSPPGQNLSGKAIFERSCARCHGQNGKGNPAADKFFQVTLPRLDSAYVQSKSDDELRDIISHGRRNMDPVRVGQAAVQHLLSPESVDAVITYVRTLKQP